MVSNRIFLAVNAIWFLLMFTQVITDNYFIKKIYKDWNESDATLHTMQAGQLNRMIDMAIATCQSKGESKDECDGKFKSLRTYYYVPSKISE